MQNVIGDGMNRALKKAIEYWKYGKNNCRDHIPNNVTRNTFTDTDKEKNLIHYKNAKAMFDKLGR